LFEKSVPDIGGQLGVYWIHLFKTYLCWWFSRTAMLFYNVFLSAHYLLLILQ